MDTNLIKERTDILKKDINKLLIDYCHETKLPVDAMQALAIYLESPGNEKRLVHFSIDVGVRL